MHYGLSTYSLVVDTSYIPKETLDNHIQYIEGEIYYTNPLDKYFKESKDSTLKSSFVVLNGKDTLRLNIIDTIMQHLYFKSDSDSIFFKSLPKNPWDKLYDLFRDSTFYFHEEKGKYVQSPIPFSDDYWLFGIKDSSGNSIDELYKKDIKQNLKDLEYSYEKWDSN